jgi:hypothetical protein
MEVDPREVNSTQVYPWKGDIRSHQIGSSINRVKSLRKLGFFVI